MLLYVRNLFKTFPAAPSNATLDLKKESYHEKKSSKVKCKQAERVQSQHALPTQQQNMNLNITRYHHVLYSATPADCVSDYNIII